MAKFTQLNIRIQLPDTTRRRTELTELAAKRKVVQVVKKLMGD